MGDAGVDLLDAGPDVLFSQRSLLGHVAVSFFSISPGSCKTNPTTDTPVHTPVDTPVDRL
jgi:hypothetical protein